MSQPQPRRRILRGCGLGCGGVLLLLVIMIAGWVISINQQIEAREINSTANPPGQIYTVDGYQLHVRVIGDPDADPTGAPLLLLHAFTTAGGEMWFPFAERLQGRTLIIPDMLGYGYSQRITEPTPSYSHQGQAALIAGLLDELGVDQVDLVGHSYGGAVSAQFTLDNPDRVRRIVFLDAQVYTIGGGFFQQLGTLPFGIGRAMTFTAIGGGGMSPSRAEADCDTACFERRQFIALIENTTDALFAFSTSPIVTRLPDDLAQISAPALVIWGEQDEIVPLSDGQRLAAELDAALVTIPDTSHWPHTTHPNEVSTAVLDFLAGDPTS
jgi:2-hydroxymuconate-semialdehyde hydrolase